MSTYRDRIALVMPALNPDEHMVTLVRELRELGFSHLILINDGSREDCYPYFRTCRNKYDCVVLNHPVNKGKGAALKYGFRYLLKKIPGLTGALTVDSDGQICPADIDKAAKMQDENPDKMVLGYREFSGDNVPFKSKLGNYTSIYAMGFLYGVYVNDAMTGLHGMSIGLIKNVLLHTKGDRFNFELNELVDCKKHNVPFLEFPIQTVYIDGNKASTYHPVKDTIRIFNQIYRNDLLIKLSWAGLDLLAFGLLRKILSPAVRGRLGAFSTLTVASALLSQLITVLYKYTVRALQGYERPKLTAEMIGKYACLYGMRLLGSIAAVDLIGTPGAHAVLKKAGSDLTLYQLSYFLERKWIWKHD